MPTRALASGLNAGPGLRCHRASMRTAASCVIAGVGRGRRCGRRPRASMRALASASSRASASGVNSGVALCRQRGLRPQAPTRVSTRAMASGANAGCGLRRQGGRRLQESSRALASGVITGVCLGRQCGLRPQASVRASASGVNTDALSTHLLVLKLSPPPHGGSRSSWALISLYEQKRNRQVFVSGMQASRIQKWQLPALSRNQARTDTSLSQTCWC